MSRRIQKIKNLILISAVLLCSSMATDVYATHIVGSDMSFQCLGNDFYQIDLTVRRDCVNGADNAQFDDPAYVGIFDAKGNPLDFLGRFGMVEMAIISIDTIFPNQPFCSYLGGEVCVTEARYQARVFLPFREGGYVLGYQRCCRNVTLNNIVDPLNTGNTSFVCLTETTLTSCNSSPTFQDWPEIVICANEPLTFEHAAVDADGDSLSYMLFTPHAGASEARPKPVPPPGPEYGTVEWAPGFSLDNLLGGEPLQIDPNTGIITATPNTVGQFLVGVLVVEWRDGEVLSKTRRNFEYNVRACQEVAEVGFEVPTLTCDGLTVEFTNTSAEGLSFMWSFDESSTDTAFQSTEVSPTFTYPEAGFYTVTLTAYDAENFCETLIRKEIGVFDSQLSADFEAVASACQDGTQNIRLTSTALEPDEDFSVDTFRWEISIGSEVLTLMGSTVDFEIDCTDSISINHTVISSNGCSAGVIRKISVSEGGDNDLFDIVGDTLRICIGDSIALFNSAIEGVSYTWDPTGGLTFGNNDLQNDPVSSPIETTLYNVSATDGVNTDEAQILVIVDMKPEFEFGIDTLEICRSGGQIPTINGSSEYVYEWSPADQVNTNSPYAPNDPLFAPLDDGYIYVTVSNGACQIMDSVYVQAIGNDPAALEGALMASPTTSTNEDGSLSVVVAVNWEEISAQFSIDSVYWTITTETDTINGIGMDISATINQTEAATLCIYIVDSDGCVTKITRMLDFSMRPPSITFVSEDTIKVCIGDTSFIVANPNSEWSYTWEPEEGLIFDNPDDRSNPRISPVESRYYYVTVTDGMTSVSDSIYIQSIDDLIDIVITEGEVCNNIASVTAINITDENTETVFEWSLDPGFSSIVATGSTVDIPIEATPVTIYVRAASSGFCGSNEASITLDQKDYGIVADITPINTCISNEGAISLVVPDTVNVTILWIASDNILTEDLGSSDINVIAHDGQTEVSVMYQVTDSEGCTSTHTVVVPVSSELIVGIEGDSESCTTTGTFYATANADIDSVDLEWSLDADFATIISTEDTVTADLGDTGIIYLRGTAGDCVSNVAERTLEMKNIVLQTDAPSRICLGDTADVEVIFPDGESYTIVWDDADEIISGLDEARVVIVATGGKDSIILSYTADDGQGCVFTDDVIIPYSEVVAPNPVSDVVCGTQDLTFSIDPIYQDGDVFWDFGMVRGEPVTSTSASPTVSFDSVGIFSATLVSTMETCNFDPFDFFYEVPEILEISSDQDLDQLICEDTILMFRAMSNGTAITWTDEDNNLLAVGDSVSIDVSGLSVVIATASDAFGCTAELRFNIMRYMFDITTDAPTDPVCTESGQLVINATDNTESDVTYSWTSASGIISGADSSSVTVDPANAGDLVLTVTNNTLSCSQEFAVPIELGNLDASINSSEGTELEFGESTVLTVSPSGSNISYMWEDGSTDGVRTVMPESGTSTTYVVTVTDNVSGCVGEASITINVALALCNDETVFLPDAFSPNKDGMNDVLRIRGNDLESIDLQVVDRWGREVYRGRSEGEAWNGQHKNTGKELAPDVYAYCLRVVCENGTEIVRRGHVTLVR